MVGVFNQAVINLQIERSERILQHYANGTMSRAVAMRELQERFGLGLADARVILKEVDAHGVPEMDAVDRLRSDGD